MERFAAQRSTQACHMSDGFLVDPITISSLRDELPPTCDGSFPRGHFTWVSKLRSSGSSEGPPLRRCSSESRGPDEEYDDDSDAEEVDEDMTRRRQKKKSRDGRRE